MVLAPSATIRGNTVCIGKTKYKNCFVYSMASNICYFRITLKSWWNKWIIYSDILSNEIQKSKLFFCFAACLKSPHSNTSTKTLLQGREVWKLHPSYLICASENCDTKSKTASPVDTTSFHIKLLQYYFLYEAKKYPCDVPVVTMGTTFWLMLFCQEFFKQW